VHLAIFDTDERRGPNRKTASGQRERADLETVRALIANDSI
jgi:hypothetical protein